MSKKLYYCNMICKQAFIKRENEKLPNLTLSELMRVELWIRLASDLTEDIEESILRRKKNNG